MDKDALTTLVMSILRDRLRVTVEIEREVSNWEDPTAYVCKVTTVLLAAPSEFMDEVTADPVVISTSETHLRQV